MTPQEMQARMVASQRAKYGTEEAYKAEMRRRSHLRKTKGNTLNHPMKCEGCQTLKTDLDQNHFCGACRGFGV